MWLRGGWRATLLLASAITFFPSPALAKSGDDTNLVPMAECVQTNVDSAGKPQSYTAFFGYENSGDTTVTIAHGTSNRLTPATLAQTQPTEFLPGRQRSVFAVNFANGTVTWHLNQGVANASASTDACSPPTVVPQVPVAVIAPLTAAGVFAFVAVRHRRRISSVTS